MFYVQINEDFGGTKRYQDKLNVDVSAEGNFYKFNKATNPLA